MSRAYAYIEIAMPNKQCFLNLSNAKSLDFLRDLNHENMYLLTEERYAMVRYLPLINKYLYAMRITWVVAT